MTSLAAIELVLLLAHGRVPPATFEKTLDSEPCTQAAVPRHIRRAECLRDHAVITRAVLRGYLWLSSAARDSREALELLAKRVGEQLGSESGEPHNPLVVGLSLDPPIG